MSNWVAALQILHGCLIDWQASKHAEFYGFREKWPKIDLATALTRAPAVSDKTQTNGNANC